LPSSDLAFRRSDLPWLSSSSALFLLFAIEVILEKVSLLFFSSFFQSDLFRLTLSDFSARDSPDGSFSDLSLRTLPIGFFF
jgi:hypothetical protein